MQDLGAWKRDQGLSHCMGLVSILSPIFQDCCGIIRVFFTGTKWKGQCNAEHTHRQAVMGVFLRDSRNKPLYFIKLLVSAQSLQKSCLDHREGRAEIYGKNILGNLEHESLWMSRVISRVINYGNHGKCKSGLKKSKSLISGLSYGIWDSHLLLCLTLTEFLDDRQHCITFY